MNQRSQLLASLDALLAPRYTILNEVGRGATAVVYLAEDRKHQRSVAIKLLRPELAQALGPDRFLREIRIAAGLNHPSIVPVHDSGRVAGTLYYVMPLVEGESLRARLEREGTLPLTEVVAITRQVARALDHAHAQGIVHRDLKPENILLAEGRALVSDFGVAYAVADPDGERLTEPGLAVGTPLYMSPEQAAAEAHIDARSDEYALGVVVYEMLAGEPPFRSASPRAVLARKMTDGVPPIRSVRAGVPAPVEGVVLRALARVPADRYASAGEFADALKAAAETGEVTRRVAGRSRRPGWPRGVVAALAVASLLTAGWLIQQRNRGATAAAGGEGPSASIAVLPLQNRTGDEEQAYLADGLTDGLTSELGRVGSLHVTPRRSAARYAESELPVPEIARALGVGVILEGSAAAVGDTVRVMLTLVDGASDRLLWSQSYSADLADVLTLERQVALAVAERLAVPLTPQERQRLVAARPVDRAVIQHTLVGNRHLENTSPGEALAAYERALAIDSTYSPAHAGVALAYTQLGNWWGTIRPDNAFPLARAAAERAIALDSTNAEAYAALATVLYLYEWDWDGAEAAFQRGMELMPGSLFARIEYANYLTAMRRFEESARLGRATLDRDLASPAAYNELGFALDLGGRDADALRTYHESLAADSAYVQTHIGLTLYHVRRNEADAALRQLEVMEQYLDAFSPSNVALAAEAYAAIGRLDDARRLHQRMVEQSRETFVAPARMAVVEACLGRSEQAFASMREAVAVRDPTLVWYNADVHPCLRPLREDPRFRDVLRALRFPRR